MKPRRRPARLRLTRSDRVSVAVATIAELSGAPAAESDVEAATWQPAARRRAYLSVRALLRQLLAESFGAAVAAGPVGSRCGGQPYLTEHPQLGVSLSHSAEWLAVAVCPGGRVGVDLQVATPVSAQMLRRCCTATARQVLSGLPPPKQRLEFARIWTVQEACVKATGEGMAGRPWRIPVEVGERVGRWQSVHWEQLRWPVPVSCACDAQPEGQPWRG